MTPTIASGALRSLLVTASAHGLHREAVLRAANVAPSAVEDPDARIPIPSLHAAWDYVLGSVTDVDIAPNPTMGDYGIVGFVVMNSTTIAEAAAHCVRYIGLWTDEPGFKLDGDTIRFSYRHEFRDGPGRRRATELAPAEIIHGARLATQRRITPREVRFAHSAPTNVARYTEFFGCRVQFDAPDHALVFRQEDLALPLVKADAQLGAFLRDIANDALAKRSTSSDSELDRVKRVIAEELQRGMPSCETVAKRLATTERTLRRRLEKSGTSFRRLLDLTRAELARAYVSDGRMPLAEVAFVLGFSEPSAFHRAFKRWTRTTAAAWRARHK